jgi:serine/threonine-protein kinase
VCTEVRIAVAVTTLESVKPEHHTRERAGRRRDDRAVRILRQLGQGTTSRVFEVEHTRIGRRAAMKVVHRYGIVPGVVDRLFIEAQAVNLINHPHVVEISDILVPDADQPDHALVMELLEGQSLADVLATEAAAAARALPIMAQICAGLAAVTAPASCTAISSPRTCSSSKRGGDRDFVKLLDFGLVKALRADVGTGTATIEGTFMGSPAYASPEQCAGKAVDSAATSTPSASCCTSLSPGRCRSCASTSRSADQADQRAPPRLSDELLATGRRSGGEDAIIQTCMMKDPAQRSLSAAQLADMFGVSPPAITTSPRHPSASRAVEAERRARGVIAPVRWPWPRSPYSRRCARAARAPPAAPSRVARPVAPRRRRPSPSRRRRWRL